MNRTEILQALCHELEVFMKFENCKGNISLIQENNFHVFTLKIRIANSVQQKLLIEIFAKFNTTFSFETLPNDYGKYYHVEAVSEQIQ